MAYLYSRPTRSNFGSGTSSPMGDFSGSVQPGSVSATIPGTTFPVPKDVTPFEQVLPYDRIFNPKLINQLAIEQTRPDLDRQQYQDSRALERGLAASGGWRFGAANSSRNRLSDVYTRMGKEQAADFSDTINNYLTDWYNRQYQSYYQNPARFTLPTLPTFDSVVGNRSMGGTSSYRSPYKVSNTGALYLPGAY